MGKNIEYSREFIPTQEDIPELKNCINEKTFKEEFELYLSSLKEPPNKTLEDIKYTVTVIGQESTEEKLYDQNFSNNWSGFEFLNPLAINYYPLTTSSYDDLDLNSPTEYPIEDDLFAISKYEDVDLN